MKLEEAIPGTKVVYKKMIFSYLDMEHGIVSSKNEKYIFVKFQKQIDKFGWDGTTSQSCNPSDLTLVPPLCDGDQPRAI